MGIVNRIQRALVLASAMALAVHAVAASPAEQQAARQDAIDKILSQPLPADAYAKPERCLASHQYDSVDILDDRHLVFKGMGDRIWVNELRRRCIGMHRRDVLQFEMHANRVCDLDTFQAFTPGLGGIRSGSCSLGRFEPVTAAQLEAMRAAVAESRKR